MAIRAAGLAAGLFVLAVALPVAGPAAGAPSQASQGTVRFAPRLTEEAVIGSAFSLYIRVEDLEHHAEINSVSSDGMAGFEFTLAWEPAALRLNGVEPGPIINTPDRSFQCFQSGGEAGSFSFACASTGQGAGYQGSATMATASFVPLRAGSSAVFLDYVGLAGPYGDVIDVEVVPVHPVRVKGSPSSSTPPGPGDPSEPTPGGPGENGEVGPGPGNGLTPDGPGTDGTPGPDDEGASPTSIGGTGDPDGGSDDPEGQVRGPGEDPDDGGSEVASGSGGDEDSSANVAVWAGAAAGGLVALGALGLAALRWRRRQLF